jgi:hypothetical protein
MHVPLRGSEIRVSSQFLNCSCRCATHRQVRTKRVTENVNPAMVQLRRSRRVVNVVCDDLFVQRLSIPIAEHSRSVLHTRWARSGGDPVSVFAAYHQCKFSAGAAWISRFRYRY